jgi:ATP-dependent helicase HrpA
LLPQVEPLRVEHYPDSILSVDGATELSLHYLHNPSEEADGITLEVPLVELPHLPAWFGEWLVTGWLVEKVASLVRCLRKETRTLLPASREVVEEFIASWEDYEPRCSLLEALVDFMKENYEIELTVEAFDLDRLPSYLQMRYAVVDDREKVIAVGRDLSGLQERLSDQVKDRFKKVAMKLWPSEACSVFQHRLGAAKLFRLENETLVNGLESVLFGREEASKVLQPSRPKREAAQPNRFGSIALAFGETSRQASRKMAPNPSPQPKSSDLEFLTSGEGWLLSNIGPDPSRNREDLLRRALGDLIEEPLKLSEWNEAKERTEVQLFGYMSNLCGTVKRILRIIETVNRLLENSESGYEESLADAQEHFNSLLAPGWVLTGNLWRKLIHWQGLELRLTRMLGSPPIKDLQKLERYHENAAAIWEGETACECERCPEAVAREKWLEEDWALRLHTFAPEIKARLK